MVGQSLQQQGVANMEAVELGLREALLKDGRKLLEQLYNQPGLSVRGDASALGEKRHSGRVKEVHTLFGEIRIARNYYYNPQEDCGRFPLDRALGLVGSFSPGLVRLSSRAAAKEGYESASEDLKVQAGVSIQGRQIQRLVNAMGATVGDQLEQGENRSTDPIPIMYVEADATGVPMVAEELRGRPGKQPDGSSKTKEVKVGSVFTQTRTDEEGMPVRDYGSTTYVGSFETAVEFGPRLRKEAFRRGLGRAQKVVFIGDGAAWVWELARVNFPMAILILDLFHALEHLHTLCEGLFGVGTAWASRMEEGWAAMLKNDQVGEVIAAARRRLAELSPEPDHELDKQIAYLENHRDKMLYKTYREQGLFYGSGVVEGGCRSVIGQRLKESGMFWSEKGGTNLLNMRVALKSNRWEECWNQINNSNYLKIRVAA